MKYDDHWERHAVHYDLFVHSSRQLSLRAHLAVAAACTRSQEVWAGPSWSSIALKVRSLLLPGFQDPYKFVLLH
jgi:hypothetical protein